MPVLEREPMKLLSASLFQNGSSINILISEICDFYNLLVYDKDDLICECICVWLLFIM